MNKHLDEYLCKKYPKIFSKRNGDMKETCMCWGFDCGNGWFFLLNRLCSDIQQHLDNPQYVVPKTLTVKFKKLWNKLIWNPVLYPIGRRYYNPNTDNKESWEKWNKFQNRWMLVWDHIPGPPIPQLVAEQVKEKFGGLRFYVSGGDEYTHALVSFAESLSYDICEECGRTDESVNTTQGWMKTICLSCATDDQKANLKAAKNKDMVKLWEKVRKDEAKKTPNSKFEDACKVAEEVMNRSKKKK